METEAQEFLWYVAHTRPRCEKKIEQYCRREGIATTLPLIRSVKKYRGKTVTFHKPLFPNYLFLQLFHCQKSRIWQHDHVARLLEVPDQQVFQKQLQDILEALETNAEIYLAPTITAGCQVKIKNGPLRGFDGWVERRVGKVEVFLRLDFIGQAAAVTIDATDLDLI